MRRTPSQYAAILGAVLLLSAPGTLLPILFPQVFHLQALRLLAAVTISFVFTMPILMKAWRYFYEDLHRDS